MISGKLERVNWACIDFEKWAHLVRKMERDGTPSQEMVRDKGGRHRVLSVEEMGLEWCVHNKH